jgi:hypothetical protein
MYARKIRVQYGPKGTADSDIKDCPLKWLDSFSMRNFTNDAVFDDTIPVTDGVMEIGKRVPLPQLREAMEDWFRRKSYIGKDDELRVAEIVSTVGVTAPTTS